MPCTMGQGAIVEESCSITATCTSSLKAKRKRAQSNGDSYELALMRSCQGALAWVPYPRRFCSTVCHHSLHWSSRGSGSSRAQNGPLYHVTSLLVHLFTCSPVPEYPSSIVRVSNTWADRVGKALSQQSTRHKETRTAEEQKRIANLSTERHLFPPGPPSSTSLCVSPPSYGSSPSLSSRA